MKFYLWHKNQNPWVQVDTKLKLPCEQKPTQSLKTKDKLEKLFTSCVTGKGKFPQYAVSHINKKGDKDSVGKWLKDKGSLYYKKWNTLLKHERIIMLPQLNKWNFHLSAWDR